ncbi:hypothetical protein [Hydrogenimonas thermophila]|uniref:Prolyl 4-hydroxylase alpha subunit domain-containing protein n=1 Tax=Hydrogenimonas thermophila TaxID=223786 RepID=A0A1I5QE33_9BACT|nr:hypothetical protein [Hydrogenimonas thermophila]WOE70814.1 oxidoreductase [Hydrogenimonas thermophila]WOE73332.1 oxidoreductase [Hydrogenimonas thermophila]SFP44230.1 hypothetical protein SAMN05216234_11945 [Hydrogenimonas thermophila]
MNKENFYKVSYESQIEKTSLTIWANQKPNPLKLSQTIPKNLSCVEINNVPGAFHIHNLFSLEECQNFIDLAENLGYQRESEVSESKEICKSDNLTWIIDNDTERIIWNRCKDLIENMKYLFENRKPLGLNAKFRFCRYNKGDYLKFHTDSACPGRRVINKYLIANAYPDRYSEMTFLIFLNEDYEGGATRFLVDKTTLTQKESDVCSIIEVDIHTPAGSVLCFPHGFHPLHWIYSFEPVLRGRKYIIRTDVLFKLD